MDDRLTRITAVWLGLVGATVLSWELGHGIGFEDPRHAGAAILVVALIKVRYVILDFMEIRHAPRAMRWVGEVWGVAVCAALVGLYLRS
jgi:hypothetical protein